MTYFAKKLKSSLRCACAALVIVCFMTGIAPLPHRTAEAAQKVEEVGKNLIVNTITSRNTETSAKVDTSLQFKEFTLDPLAYRIAQKFIQQMTASTINWINTGFEGSPAFITNLGQHLLNIGDEIATGFVYGSSFENLCEPFRDDVRIAVALELTERRDPNFASECTVRDTGSIWDQWFDMVLNPQNNIYGATAMKLEEVTRTQQYALENEQREIDWANGFLSVEDCSSGTCVTVTPGHTIAENLNFKLTIADNSLVSSDELNELISNLLGGLSQQAFSGVGGLLGLSFAGQNGGSSFLQNLYNDNGGQGGSSSEIGFINEALEFEKRYLSLHTPLIKELTEIKKEAPTRDCPDADDIEKDAEKLLEGLNEEAATSTASVAKLTAMRDEYLSTTSATGQIKIINQFLAFQKSGVLHDEVDIGLRELELADVKKAVEALRKRLDTCDKATS